MEMNHVGDRARFGDADVRGDDGAAQTIGEQLAVMHARPADDPGLAVHEPPDDELVGTLGDDERGIRVLDGHPVAARGGEAGLNRRQMRPGRRRRAGATRGAEFALRSRRIAVP